MTEFLQFYVHCSRTRQRYIVSGYVQNGTLHWAAAFIPKPGYSAPALPPPSAASYSSIDSSKFRCPCCETSGANNGTKFGMWTCSTCGSVHCMGTDNLGNCHGSCGQPTCIHERAKFDNPAPLSVQIAQGHDR